MKVYVYTTNATRKARNESAVTAGLQFFNRIIYIINFFLKSFCLKLVYNNIQAKYKKIQNYVQVAIFFFFFFFFL